MINDIKASTFIGKPEEVLVVSGKAASGHNQYNLKWRLQSAAGGTFQKVVIEVKKVNLHFMYI